jgi:hypothetical protein
MGLGLVVASSQVKSSWVVVVVVVVVRVYFSVVGHWVKVSSTSQQAMRVLNAQSQLLLLSKEIPEVHRVYVISSACCCGIASAVFGRCCTVSSLVLVSRCSLPPLPPISFLKN